MMGCTNEATHWLPRGFDYVEIKKECGRIGYDGEPVYCRECRGWSRYTMWPMRRGCLMYGQDLEFVVAIGAFLFICMVLFSITESVMHQARKRRRK